jgi:hypothetical protein
MKAIIVKDELKIDVSSVFDATAYPSDGIFLVDDGMSYQLAIVSAGAVTTLFIPREAIVKEYEKTDETVIEKELKEIKNLLKVKKQEKPQHISGDIDFAGITKLVAVAQNPDLIKGT